MAQDTLRLETVEIVSQKGSISQTGKKIQKIDSSLLQQYRLNSVADLIGINSGVYIKSYGLGASSSSSFRGGSANQTALLWNGINIQNAMLGQADLSVLPSFLFSNVEIEYGGSSSLWGSGAVAGSIHLNNELKFDKGLQTTFQAGGGSFGLNNQALSQLSSFKKFASSTKLYHSNSVNNYLYNSEVDGSLRSLKLKQANYDFKGLLQEMKWLIKANQILTIHIWLNDNQRKLPSFNDNVTKSVQNDKAARLSANWTYVKNKFKSDFKLAYLIDGLDYTDSLASVFSKSKIYTSIIESQNYLIHKNHTFQLGLNFTNNLGQTNNYNASKTLQKLAFLVGDQYVLLKNKIKINVAARLEKFNTGAMHLTGSVSGDYRFLKHLLFSVNASKVYRQASLNELYWQPGGNAQLKPEEGYTAESNLKLETHKNKIYFEVGISAFDRIISNWILWTPGPNGQPSPLNIQKVWNRGLETNWNLKYKNKKFASGIQVNTSYVLSTVLSNEIENSNVVAKQLIYTPRYNLNGNIHVSYSHFTFYYLQQYVGYRYTTSDNSAWLNPYYYGGLKFQWQFGFKKINLISNFSVNNLYNQSYQVIAARPMPSRNYEFGIQVQLKNNK